MTGPPKRQRDGGIDVSTAPRPEKQNRHGHHDAKGQRHQQVTGTESNASAPNTHHQGGAEEFAHDCPSHRIPQADSEHRFRFSITSRVEVGTVKKWCWLVRPWEVTRRVGSWASHNSF